MAFDISVGKTGHHVAPQPTSFDEFYETHAVTVATALLLACNDQALAARATREALAKTCQQWKRVRSHPHIVGWALHVGIEHADKVLSSRGPVSVNAATGGYVRGLNLVDALAALPLRQRTALVMAHHLGWSDRHVATAAGASVDRVSTLRTRATTFVAHHLHNEPAEAVELIAGHLAFEADVASLAIDDSGEIQQLGRRRTIRNGVVAAAAVGLIIVVGAALVQVASSSSPQVSTGPAMVAPPSNSSDWLPPVGDGQGGFVALNTSRASRFTRSADGQTWFDRALWNSRAIDLRTEVSGFKRTGGRYVATVEAPSSLRSLVNPYVATSRDLDSWTERQIDIEVPEEPDGLRLGFEVLSVVSAESGVLAAVDIVESIDYVSLGAASRAVCVEVNYDALRVLHMCDGEITTIERPSSLVAADLTRFMFAAGAGPFTEVSVPAGVDPRSLASDGSRFAATNAVTGELSTSTDGRIWTVEDLPVEPNRFVLVEGDSDRQELLTIVPSATGWTSVLLDQVGETAVAELGVGLDPSSIWTKPELSVGPAGWALFVTTSRPWERVEESRGWAVDTGTWIVSRLPESPIITAQNEDTGTTYRFIDSSPLVDHAGSEGVRLTAPDTGEKIVQVTDDDIARSRSAGVDDRAAAQVFFSADGLSWSSIWQTSDDTWFPSVAVGDDELLISGAKLTGPPITVPLNQ